MSWFILPSWLSEISVQNEEVVSTVLLPTREKICIDPSDPVR